MPDVIEGEVDASGRAGTFAVTPTFAPRRQTLRRAQGDKWAGLLAVLLLTACSQTQQAPQTAVDGPKHGGVLTLLMNQTGDPPSFDLHQESVSAAIEAAGSAYDALVQFAPTDPSRVVPDLAESWEQLPDGFRFRLRDKVRFHNGDPFSAADAAFSLERVKSPPSGVVSPRGPALQAIESIDTLDERTAVVRLKRPNPSLLPNLAQGWMAIYDKGWVQANGLDAAKDQMMGTGPFRLKERVRGSSLELERNPDYWDAPQPYLDGLRYLIVPDFSTRTAAFRTGQVMITRLFARDAAELEQQIGDRVGFTGQVAPSFGALILNTNRKPFNNPMVREAVSLATDRRGAVEVLAQGDGEVGGYMMPGGAWALPANEVVDLPGYKIDRSRAREIMARQGALDSFEVEVLTRSGQTFENLAVFAAEQLKQAGIRATVKPVETVDAIRLAQQGEFDALTWGHEFALDDPDAVFGEFYLCKGPRNYSALCVPEVEDLYQRQSQEMDPARRLELARQMERAALLSNTKIITHWNKRHDGVWRYVKGYVQHPSPFNNVRYAGVWLER